MNYYLSTTICCTMKLCVCDCINLSVSTFYFAMITTTRPLHPSLPPKPLSLPTLGEPSAQASNHVPLCALCHLETPKYTCPGCSTRTCSLSCSSSHKSLTGCTGQRNKASYVPMNKYSWGTMVDDYVFLEDVGRRVSDWGREIVQGGFQNSSKAGGLTDNRGVGSRGRGRGGGGGRGGHSKRDILKMQLEAKDIEVDLLPLGMDRRRSNQSTWDFKCVPSIILSSGSLNIYKKADCIPNYRICIPQTERSTRTVIPATCPSVYAVYTQEQYQELIDIPHPFQATRL